jgi:hypothetical protein
MIFVFISILGYDLKAIVKPSVEPCCICQKEFSKQMRSANHVAMREKIKDEEKH